MKQHIVFRKNANCFLWISILYQEQLKFIAIRLKLKRQPTEPATVFHTTVQLQVHCLNCLRSVPNVRLEIASDHGNERSAFLFANRNRPKAFLLHHWSRCDFLSFWRIPANLHRPQKWIAFCVGLYFVYLGWSAQIRTRPKFIPLQQWADLTMKGIGCL